MLSLASEFGAIVVLIAGSVDAFFREALSDPTPRPETRHSKTATVPINTIEATAITPTSFLLPPRVCSGVGCSVCSLTDPTSLPDVDLDLLRKSIAARPATAATPIRKRPPPNRRGGVATNEVSIVCLPGSTDTC